MSRKRSNRSAATPNFVLWSKESQKRFEAIVAKQTDLLARLEVLEANHRQDQRLSEQIGEALAQATADLRSIAERLEVRSKAAKKANDTRKRLADAVAAVAATPIPALPAEVLEAGQELAQEFFNRFGHWPGQGDEAPAVERIPLEVVTPAESFEQMKGG